ncbi:cytochrome p450 monooxygenase [Corynascus similis CBS 632.67]
MFVICFAGYRIYRLFIYPYFVSPLRHLPGPKNHHFLIGHTLNQFRSGHPNQPYVSWMRKWPTSPLIRYFDVGNSDAVLVTSLEAHKEILHEKVYEFQKPPFFVKLIADIVGFGIGFAEGEQHRQQRRGLAALFSSRNLEGFIPLLWRKASQLCDHFVSSIENKDGLVEVVSIYSKLTLDIMGLFAIGTELDELASRYSGNTNMSFHACYRELFEPDGLGQLLVAINGVVPIRWIPIEANRRFKNAHTILRSMIRAVIRDRVQQLDPRITMNDRKGMDNADGKKNNNDLLTWMVAKRYYAADNGDRWSEDEILDQILTFLAAGHQTTADALTWATQMLIEYPTYAQQLTTEITSLLDQNLIPSYRDIESLPYLHNFTREVLRVHCPGINVAREAIHDVVIQGVLIPKGTTVLMQPAIIQKNPTIWGSDCDEFRPDRWNALEGEAADPWAFAAFSHGPRICIGRAFSMLEFKIILIQLVSRFRFEDVDNRKAGEIKLVNPSPMLRPDGGIRVKVERKGV